MKLKDVIDILIVHGVLVSSSEIKLPDRTGELWVLSKKAIQHNNILKDLTELSESDKFINEEDNHIERKP